MFTGLIEAVGVVTQIATVGDSQLKLTIESDLIVEDTRIGDSVAVNGCCLTVVEIDNHVFSVEVVNETILRTNLSLLQPEDKVNLERSLRVGDRLGGHFVQGHIDGMGEVLQPPPKSCHKTSTKPCTACGPKRLHSYKRSQLDSGRDRSR